MLYGSDFLPKSVAGFIEQNKRKFGCRVTTPASLKREKLTNESNKFKLSYHKQFFR